MPRSFYNSPGTAIEKSEMREGTAIGTALSALLGVEDMSNSVLCFRFNLQSTTQFRNLYCKENLRPLAVENSVSMV